MRLQILCVFAVLGSVLATEECLTCRPIELQNGAGIAIDLTMAYGTVAIKFRNGTTVDIVKVDGSPEYMSAMRTIAADAKNVRAGKPSSLPWYKYEPPEPPVRPYARYPYFTPYLLYRFLAQKARRALPFLQPKKPIINDPDITAIAGLLTELHSAIQAVDPPIKHNLVVLSSSDFEADTRFIYRSRFQIACEQAGLEEFRSQLMSRAALEYYGIRDCFDDIPDDYCYGSSEEKINTVLAITYSGASLGVTSLTRWLGSLYPNRVSENFDHGAESVLRAGNPHQYWKDVKSFIEEGIENEKIDYLMMLGSHAMDPDLLRVIKEVFEARGNMKPWMRYLAQLRDPDEHLFAAARGAAETARVGMVNGFDACWVPDVCEQSDGNSEL